ncbi:type II toxin-antitoxin system Phd/YefM family antitoxin [Candidatus Gottesmanbacteria bacterium]|nr:type II toxin-antitoxin system Phd/YefM family antitoxin [Candidatus Gottesmanbacteria bacterium]
MYIVILNLRYTMQQIISITQFRNSLSNLAKQIKQTKMPVVVVRDSQPELVVSSYQAYQEREEELLKNKTLALLNQGQAAFRKYLRKRGIDPEKLSDQQAEEILNEL